MRLEIAGNFRDKVTRDAPRINFCSYFVLMTKSGRCLDTTPSARAGRGVDHAPPCRRRVGVCLAAIPSLMKPPPVIPSATNERGSAMRRRQFEGRA
jgi:hypothetical protein